MLRSSGHRGEVEERNCRNFIRSPGEDEISSGLSTLDQHLTTINGQPSTFNFSGAQQRRPQPPQQGLAGMGGMGGSMRPPGKSGPSFDVILSRLQGELQKSRVEHTQCGDE